MERQNPASSVSRSSLLSSDFPPVACFRCRMPQMHMALPPDLATAVKAMRTFASVHRERVADGRI